MIPIPETGFGVGQVLAARGISQQIRAIPSKVNRDMHCPQTHPLSAPNHRLTQTKGRRAREMVEEPMDVRWAVMAQFCGQSMDRCAGLRHFVHLCALPCGHGAPGCTSAQLPFLLFQEKQICVPA